MNFLLLSVPVCPWPSVLLFLLSVKAVTAAGNTSAVGFSDTNRMNEINSMGGLLTFKVYLHKNEMSG